MLQFFLVAAGGASGALTRFLIGNFLKIYLQNNFYATLSINIVGSFFIGFLISLGYTKNLSDNLIKYFLIIGFLGSFTTFSAFSYEVIDLFLSRKFFLSFTYVILSVILCIIAAYLGMYINKLWLKLLKSNKILRLD